MEISQITGPIKDPVARLEDDKQIKQVGAVNAVQPAKEDGASKQSTGQEQEAPSFAHVRQDALQLLLRAITAHLNETIPTITPAQPLVTAGEAALTPETAASRIVAMLAITFERYRTMHDDLAESESVELFHRHTDQALRDGLDETRTVLSNLGMLDETLTQRLDRTLKLVRNTLERLLPHPEA